MRYVNANDILPKHLLEELQSYVQGDLIYIPKPEEQRIKWGAASGERKRLDERNKTIKTLFKNGTSLETLSIDFCLSIETIKKIVYRK
ncbi:Mor transcription activator family protein OS=Ureibacillus acetophenoni OX=614649 GN=SAMN05877842_11160 PE=4 SV=1 [Ureibacillus acetophenoni]|uniref:CD3324 family protein n=1 Tax=Ureibacillus sp. MALMAid1270 TaxID=3411629 RepID=UPI003BA818C1